MSLSGDISKVIADRLATLLPKIISHNHGGFVYKRVITESITLAQEVTQNRGDTTICDSAVLKIDMAKTFDRVNRGFLSKVLKAFGFGESWIHLIENCVCSNQLSISLKG